MMMESRYLSKVVRKYCCVCDTSFPDMGTLDYLFGAGREYLGKNAGDDGPHTKGDLGSEMVRPTQQRGGASLVNLNLVSEMIILSSLSSWDFLGVLVSSGHLANRVV